MNILVLCQHFAPSNKTASFRSMAFARYLPHHNITPYILTATQAETTNEDNHHFSCPIFRVNCGTTVLHSWRNTYSGTFIGKVCGLFDELLDNYSFYNPLRHLEPAASDILNQNDIDLILVTAPNFSLIRVAQKLAQKHKVKWIIDFRDDWVTNEEVTGFTRLKYQFETHLFRSYIKGADALMAVSEYQCQKLAKKTGIPTKLIENGYDHYEASELEDKDRTDAALTLSQDRLNLVYAGTLYKSQKLTYLRQILDKLAVSIRDKIALYFVGSQTAELTDLARDYNNIHIIPHRLSKAQTDKLLDQSDGALYIAYQKRDGRMIKGVPSSKLYEYIKLHKPVFMAPSDHDIAQSILMRTGLGLSSGSVDSDAHLLEKLVFEKQKAGHIKRKIDETEYQNISRRAVTARLADWLLADFSSQPSSASTRQGQP